jgi:hypothetical protein
VQSTRDRQRALLHITRVCIALALMHSLDKPETLVKLYANLGRIRLVSSDAAAY